MKKYRAIVGRRYLSCALVAVILPNFFLLPFYSFLPQSSTLMRALFCRTNGSRPISRSAESMAPSVAV